MATRSGFPERVQAEWITGGVSASLSGILPEMPCIPLKRIASEDQHDRPSDLFRPDYLPAHLRADAEMDSAHSGPEYPFQAR